MSGSRQHSLTARSPSLVPSGVSAIERHFAHADLADRVRDRAALAVHNVNLTQLRGDLFRLVASL